MATSYNDDSISQLIGAERIRKRPASMLGDAGLAGARHGFTEIYGNALDESSAGYGNRLDVKHYADGSVSVRDYGRGVPLGWNSQSDAWNWHLIYNELYSGGKYDNGQWYLRSVESDAEFLVTSDLKKVYKSEFGVDLSELEVGKEYHIKDMAFHLKDENTLVSRVVNESWATLTWDKLNKRLNYLASVGLNGLGAASTQYTSEYFTVKSYQDGKCKSRSFKRGVPLVNGEPFNVFTATPDEIRAIPEEVEATDEVNGTFVHWKPDDTVFTDVDLGEDWIYGICSNIADIAGVELNFVDEISGKEIHLPAGDLTELAKAKCRGSHLTLESESEELTVFKLDGMSHGHITLEGKDFVYVAKCDIALVPTVKKVNPLCFHNSVLMNSGIQYDAINGALSKFLSEKLSSRGLKLERTDFEQYFGVFVSSYSNYASFRNQTKDGVSDAFIYNMIYQAIYTRLSTEYGKGNRYIVEVVDKVAREAEIRMISKETAEYKRSIERTKREKEPEKFTSCVDYEEKRYANTELWIAEGDSAGGSIISSRSRMNQAVYTIRGKGLNVLKTNIKRILQNKEIREIFSLIGTGIDLNLPNEKTFNIEDLRFNKIIFATDADEDGYQIRVLLFLIFYRLAPDLIREGHVYIAETPRFSITLTDGTRLYALDDRERDDIKSQYVGRISKINRFKGLGEVNADVLRETTIAPETRHLQPVTCDFENTTERELIDALFGCDKFKQRKEILTAILGADVADMFEDNALLLDSLENEEFEEETEYIQV